MSEYQIQSKNFLPENLQNYDFYPKLTEILDYVLDAYHTKNIDILKALYDIKNANFDYEKCLSLLGSSEFIDFDVDSEQFKVLCIILSNLYEIKGTKKGLKYLLRLLDMEATIYEWYDINKWYQEGDPRWESEVPKCSIVLELGLEHRPIGVCNKYDKWALPRTGSPEEALLGENEAFEDTEGKFKDFATRLLWICVTLTEIRWAKTLTDYVDVSENFFWYFAEVFYDKYSPYVMNCPNMIQVGFPFYQEYPYIGETGLKVGDFQYKGYPFVVRSFAEYNDPINYDGWTNTGFVGYSETVSDLPIVGDGNLIVGQEFYWLDNSSFTYPAWLSVGNLLHEGNISEGCPIVSGCKVSIIEAHTETAFENNCDIHRGIYVGYENFVQPPDNLGDSYLVDTQPGDVLFITPENSLTENISFVEEITNIEKETKFTSNISDIYEPFLVGDPDKFVGDTNLFVGHDYFNTWFEAYTETTFQEQFYTSCLQVGEWGHAYFPETTYFLTVGQIELFVGESYFVGENVLPQHYEDRNPLLYTGTCLIVGSENTVTPTIKVGQGFNFVGELATWDGTNFVGDSKNVIYEISEFDINPEVIEEEIPVLDTVETNLSDFELISNIRDSLWNKLVGASPTVGSVDYFTVGSIYQVGSGFVGDYSVGDTVENILIGASPVVGYYEFSGTDYVASDPYCILEVEKEFSVSTERFLLELPVVGDPRITVGYIGNIPALIGSSHFVYLTVGDTGVLVGYDSVVGEGHEEIDGNPYLVGDGLLVGQSEYINTVEHFVNVSATDEIATGSEMNIASTTDVLLTAEVIEEEIPVLDTVETSLSDFELTSNIRDSLWNKLVGASPVVGDFEAFSVGTVYTIGMGFVGDYNVADTVEGVSVGNSPAVGFGIFTGNAYVESDPYSNLEVSVDTSEFTETFNIELPVVGNNSLVVGFAGDMPVNVGDFYFIGDGLIAGQTYPVTNVDVFVAQSPTGFVSTDYSNNIYSTFEITPAQEIIEEEIPVLDALSYEEQITAFEEIVFPETIGNHSVSNSYYVSKTDAVGDIFVGNSNFVGGASEGVLVSDSLLVGDAEKHVAEDSVSKLTIDFESDALQSLFATNTPIVLPTSTSESDLVLSSFVVGEGVVGQPTSNPSAEYGVSSFLTCIIEEDDTDFMSVVETVNSSSEFENNTSFDYSEQFIVNDETVPVVLGNEESEALILTPTTDEINPVYLSGEEEVPYEFNPTFNPTNSINTTFTYTIDET
jgi:hypothetical protein